MNTNQQLAAERHFAFNRRHFLRGLGACVALPTFESLGALKAPAAPTSKLATTASGAPEAVTPIPPAAGAAVAAPAIGRNADASVGKATHAPTPRKNCRRLMAR